MPTSTRGSVRSSRGGGSATMSNASMVSQGNVFKQMKNRSCSDRLSRPAFWAMLSEIMAFVCLIPVAIIYWDSCKSFSLVMIAMGFLMFYMIIPQLVPLKICRPFRIHSYTKKLVIWAIMAISVIVCQYVFAGDCIGWYWYGMALSLPAFLFLAASLRPPTQQSRDEAKIEKRLSQQQLISHHNPSQGTSESQHHIMGSPIFGQFARSDSRPSSRHSSMPDAHGSTPRSTDSRPHRSSSGPVSTSSRHSRELTAGSYTPRSEFDDQV